MTLSTDIYVLDEVEPTELFRFCQGLLAKYDEQKRPAEAQFWAAKQDSTWRDGKSFVEPGNPWSLDNEPFQDLPAWLMMGYRPGAPLRTPEQAAECDDCEPGCDKQHYYRACWVNIDFDTAYGYRDSEGRGCGDLHALLVAEVGQWCDQRGVRWEWRNEYSGEVHGGEDKYEKLIDLVSSGFAASAWFRTSAMPAIAAMTEGGAR